MEQSSVTMDVRRVDDAHAVIDISGELTAACEDALMAAYGRAGEPGVQSVVLNFSGLQYMNSSGIGLLVTLLVRANRQQQRLAAYGLSEHYEQIFELTRLDEAISIHATEDEALAGAPGRRAS